MTGPAMFLIAHPAVPLACAVFLTCWTIALLGEALEEDDD